MKKELLLLSVLSLSFGCGVKNTATTQKFEQANSKITYSSHQMSLAATNTTFTEIATINSTVYNSKKLQATGLVKDGSLVYISYNTQYDEVRGGLDIVSLSNSNQPTIVSSLVSENSEYAELKKKGNYLFMVGQRSTLERNYATLAVVDVSTPTTPSIVSTLDFDGYYATSIDIQGNVALITVPNLGVVELNITNPLSPQITTTSAIKGNSLFARKFGSKTIVLGGSTSHELSQLSGATVSTIQSISSQVQEAPSRFTIKGNTVYTNGGNTGLTIIDKIHATPELLHTGGVTTGTGNGISTGSCNKLFLAQGEVGLMVLDVSAKSNPILEGTFDYSTDHGSANNVFYLTHNNQSYVFVADGLAGVKVVKANNSCDEDEDDNDHDDDDNNDDNHKGLVCKVFDLSAISPKPTSLPNLSLMSHVGFIYPEKLDVISQTSLNSFPLFPTSLKYLKEYYAVECEGMWESKNVGPGILSLGSDDGSKLYIDDTLVIDNDGLHSPFTKTVPMTFAKKDYKVKIQYFQGPHNQIQLELKHKLNSSSSLEYMDEMFH